GTRASIAFPPWARREGMPDCYCLNITLFILLIFELGPRATPSPCSFILYVHRHAFYPGRGRQMCTLQHLMPLYIVHSLFTTYYNVSCSKVLRATTENFSKNRKYPVVLCPTRVSNPTPLIRQSHLQPERQFSLFYYKDNTVSSRKSKLAIYH
ncbi:hypothetical protein SFRURICE_018382, partial [Spodoptera frugiperda]